MSAGSAPAGLELSPTVAWSRRVRRVGGLIQLAFAAFWLIRGSLAIAGTAGTGLTGSLGALALIVALYGIRSTADVAPRPTSPGAGRIEKEITLATIIQLVASFAAPAIVIAAGRDAWVLPSIAITIGPLLLWLDHRVDIHRYRLVGWTLIAGPVLLAATLSGTALTATTGIGAGLLLLASAAAGFHDLALIRRRHD